MEPVADRGGVLMNTCELCNKPVDRHGRGVWRYLTGGWEKVRLPGEGVHPIRGRELTERFVHTLCLDIKERGGMQESLL